MVDESPPLFSKKNMKTEGETLEYVRLQGFVPAGFQEPFYGYYSLESGPGIGYS